jgi:hypothetical protein
MRRVVAATCCERVLQRPLLNKLVGVEAANPLTKGERLARVVPWLSVHYR